jgi:hypothetical protein
MYKLIIESKVPDTRFLKVFLFRKKTIGIMLTYAKGLTAKQIFEKIEDIYETKLTITDDTKGAKI